MLTVVMAVLRRPTSLMSDAEDERGMMTLIGNLLLIGATGAAVFGATIGSYRGGWQVLFAGAKLPVLLLVPLIVCAPAIRQLYGAFDVVLDGRRLAVAAAVAFARTGVLAAGLAPVVWLVYSVGIEYHLAVLVLAGSLAVVAAPGLWHLLSSCGGVHSVRPRALAAAASGLALLSVVFAQTGWLLRPFVVRPTAEVTLFRPIEADVGSALVHTGMSSVGVDGDWDASRSGLIGGGLRYSEAR